MGRFRDGPLIGNIPWIIPLLLWAVPIPCLVVRFSTQSIKPFKHTIVTSHNDLLPNGMMAIRYGGIRKMMLLRMSACIGS